MNNQRRQVLAGTAGLAVASIAGSGRVFADAAAVDAQIGEFAGEATVSDAGPLSLDTPEIAENGNSVPVSVSVDSPMSEDSYVESVMLLAEGNPTPQVATFHFTPASGQAMATTRMRLAKTQNVVAVAKMNTGEIYRTANEVKVTIGGCGG